MGTFYFLMMTQKGIFLAANQRFCAHGSAGGSTKKWKISKKFLFLYLQILTSIFEKIMTSFFATEALVGVIIEGSCLGPLGLLPGCWFRSQCYGVKI